MKAITYFGTFFSPLPGAWPSLMHLAFGRLFLQFTAITKFIFTSKKTEIKGGTTLKKEAVFKKKEKKKKEPGTKLVWKVFFSIIAS